MKIYSSSNRTKKSRTKLLYALVAVVSVMIITLSVVLTAVLSNKNDLPVSAPIIDAPSDEDNNTDAPIVDKPVIKDPVLDTGATMLTFTLPVENGSVIREASLDRLVFMPSLNMWKTHSGVDFSASENAPVLAITAGTVLSVEQTTLEGMVVTVSHANGMNSVYKSLSSASVAEGDSVSAGQEIGKAGTMLTEKTDGVHLHLEMTVNGELVNPLLYLDGEINK